MLWNIFPSEEKRRQHFINNYAKKHICSTIGLIIALCPHKLLSL